MEEFVIEWLKGESRAAISAPSGTKIKNKLKKLAEEKPTECDCYENPDGYVFGHVPVSYIRIQAPREYSEEAKKKLVENFRNDRA